MALAREKNVSGWYAPCHRGGHGIADGDWYWVNEETGEMFCVLHRPMDELGE